MVEQTGQASLIGRHLGNYAVEALLGRGATGAVYLARDTALSRPVALKVLLGSLSRNQDQVTRFLEEAKAAAPLQHPHIVGVYEAGIRDGTPFIAMEYIEGESLDRFLRRNSPLDWRHALYVGAQVTAALQCAHQMGVVHRDVKPANILLDRLGHVRLTDFGIARLQQDTMQRGQGYACFGTPDYMSPEQCGAPFPIGPRSDFFSLGVMLYEMMANTLPFAAQDAPALIRQIANHTPARLNRVTDDIPDDVARLVANLMEKQPAKRPAAASSILSDIERIQRENGGASAVPEALNAFIREMAAPVAARVDTPLPGERRPLRPSLRLKPERKRLAPVSAMAKAAVMILMLVGVLGATYWHAIEAPQVARAAAPMDSRLVSVDGSGRVWANLPGEHWLVEDIQWVGNSDVALVTVVGRPGTSHHGSRGMLAIDPSTGTVLSTSAPVGPMRDSGFAGANFIEPQFGTMPVSASHAPLASAFVVAIPCLDGREGVVQALAQRWDRSEPQGEPLFELDRTKVGYQDFNAPWDGNVSQVPVAIHPDGHTLCILIREAGQGGDYLVERDVRWRNKARLGRQLTTTTDEIAAGSFRYSNNGTHLAYERMLGERDSSLWVVDTRAEEPDGIPVATGTLKGYSFSPDGLQMAVTRTRNGENMIVFTDTSTGREEIPAGPGSCDAASWHPTGDRLVVQAPDAESGVDQLWLVSTMPPYSRERMTTHIGGAQQEPAVSRSGRWVATTSETERGTAVLFIPWDSSRYTRVSGEAS